MNAATVVAPTGTTPLHPAIFKVGGQVTVGAGFIVIVEVAEVV